MRVGGGGGGGGGDGHRRRLMARTAYTVQVRRNNARVLQESGLRRTRLCPLATEDIAQRLHLYRAGATVLLDDSATHPSNLAYTGAPRQRLARVPPLLQRRSTAVTAATTAAADGTVAATEDGNQVSVAGSTHEQELGKELEGWRRGLPLRSSAASPLSLDRPSSLTTTTLIAAPAAPSPLPRSYDDWLRTGCPTAEWATLLDADLYGREEVDRAFLTIKYSIRGTYVIPTLATEEEGAGEMAVEGVEGKEGTATVERERTNGRDGGSVRASVTGRGTATSQRPGSRR